MFSEAGTGSSWAFIFSNGQHQRMWREKRKSGADRVWWRNIRCPAGRDGYMEKKFENGIPAMLDFTGNSGVHGSIRKKIVFRIPDLFEKAQKR